MMRSEMELLVTLPEECEITAMTEFRGLLYIATDTNRVYAFDPVEKEIVLFQVRSI